MAHSLRSVLMPEESPPTQKTQPRGIDPKTGKPYEPVEIPVPKREDFFGVLKRAFAGKSAPPSK